MPNERDLKPEREAIRDAFIKNPEGVKALQGAMKNGTIVGMDSLPTMEPVNILCVLWEYRTVAGCVRDACGECKRDVSLSPSTVEMMAAHQGIMHTICVECFAKTHLKDGHEL